MEHAHKATPEQKRRAMVSAVVLAAVVAAIYGVVLLKYFTAP